MGCDGGTIPRRDELVRVKKKPEAKDKDSELGFYWRCCYLTQLELQPPIVTCGLGHLYSKLKLIEAMIQKELPDGLKHIKTLKDVKNLNLTPNPEYNAGDEKKEGAVDSRSTPYICPVIGLEMSGTFRFVALWSCGCVFSERALKEIKTHNCHKCQQPFTDDDVVVLNPSDNDLPLMRMRMEVRKPAKKKSKKAKEEKVEEPVDQPSTSTSAPSTSAAVTDTNKKVSNLKTKPVNGVTPAPANGALAVKRSAEISSERLKKAKKDYSVAKDPQASDVYKSLFTSHESEKQQTRAHWITYNPFYN